MKLIEVEKKVLLEPHQIKKIAQTATFIKETRIQDTYFDTHDYRYTTENKWLRQRDGAFELKVGIKKQNGSMDRYEEITDPKQISEHLTSTAGRDLPVTLAQEGIFPFCSFSTWRRSFQIDELRIDIDEADFGDLHYRVAEIEIMVADTNKIEAAEEKIARFAKEMKIDITIPVCAKLTYYIYSKRPAHYQALVQNKVIKPIILDIMESKNRKT